MKWFTCLLALPAMAVMLSNCASDGFATYVPGPASKVTRTQAVASAYAYTQVCWTPTAANVLHGTDRDGMLVHTPDFGLFRHNHINGWWKPGEMQYGMPYQWGGFDTPSTFLSKIHSGWAAGDIATANKRAQGDAAVSRRAAGVDCSGFVSRCWRLSRPYSTAQLPEISYPIAWSDLKPGDILLTQGHVLLFSHWAVPGSQILAYEAGPFPRWKVSANRMSTSHLIGQQYQPRRYNHIVESPDL